MPGHGIGFWRRRAPLLGSSITRGLRLETGPGTGVFQALRVATGPGTGVFQALGITD